MADKRFNAIRSLRLLRTWLLQARHTTGVSFRGQARTASRRSLDCVFADLRVVRGPRCNQVPVEEGEKP